MEISRTGTCCRSEQLPQRQSRCWCPDWEIILVSSLVLSNGVSAQSGGGQEGLAQSISIVEISIRLSLDRLFEVAEQEMPLQAGNWRDWQKSYGIKTKYRAWRGPLYFTARGDVLLVQAHVRYWIKAHKKVLGTLNLKSSCGVNELPRQAVIGVQVRMGWRPPQTSNYSSE